MKLTTPFARSPKRQLFGVLVLLLSVRVLLPETAFAQARESLVQVDTVRETTLNETVPVIGRLVSGQSGTVAAQINGPVSVIHVAVGDRVQEGQIIAELDIETLSANRALVRSELQASQAQLKTFEARRTLAKQQLDRLEKLRSSTAFSKANYDDAIQNLQIADAEVAQRRADIAAVRARLNLAEIELSKATVLAPYDGVVLSKETEAGEYVSEGDAVINLMSPQSLEIEVDVPSSRLDGVQPGQSFTFTMADGSPLIATLRAILPRENVLTRTRPVRLSADLSGHPELADNQSITLLVPAGRKRQALTVHKDAVVQNPNGPIAFVAQDGSAQLRSLQLGQQVENRIEVLSGLSAGEYAVIRGNERLRPGTPLKFDTPETAAQTGEDAGDEG
ncbi:efflux RND transporter periplasmic adaptor subunit [Kiloniella sp. b19]|uniref:efflux RND transporter periplasmic adaptor subunit n=1 Tax=Kiloniella sp. GXU_MW_B19 TaxID=3141326 RepID=UPI0031E3EE07